MAVKSGQLAILVFARAKGHRVRDRGLGCFCLGRRLEEVNIKTILEDEDIQKVILPDALKKGRTGLAEFTPVDVWSLD